MVDDAKIQEALNKLDPGTDAHWTKGGLPDLNAMREFAGEYVSREACTTARPEFNRDAARQAKGNGHDQGEIQAEQGAATSEGAGAPAEPPAEVPQDPASTTSTTAAPPVGPDQPRRRHSGFRHNWPRGE